MRDLSFLGKSDRQLIKSHYSRHLMIGRKMADIRSQMQWPGICHTRFKNILLFILGLIDEEMFYAAETTTLLQ